MNLTRRFSITHGFIALLSVAIVLAVMIGGAHFLFLSEARDAQRRQVEAFALAARESYFAHEDVAVLNFIRMAVKDDTVVFAAYTGEKGKTRLVMPSSLEGENLTAGVKVLPNSSEEVALLSLTRLVLSDSSDEKNEELATGLKVLPDGRQVEILSLPVEASGKAVAAVFMAYDPALVEEKVRSQVEEWVGLGLVGGGAAMCVALVVSVLLARHLALPLRRIQAGTREVRAGKLDKLVDVKRSDEIGALARDFNDMVLKLKELEAMKRDFVAGVTHDFGTPLHAIRTALELLQEGKPGPLTNQQAEYLLMVSNSTIQLTSFINNLLTTARIEAAKSEPYYESLDVMALAQEVVNLYRPQAQKKGVELLVFNEASAPRVVTDAVMFRQILTNLISNAMKYTLEGSITVILAEAGGNFVLKVMDTGIGIDPKNQELIFDRFFRVRQPKDFPVQQGSGLGLSIVKGLAEAMGGSVSVESRLGAGATFTVRLPKRFAGLPAGKEARY